MQELQFLITRIQVGSHNNVITIQQADFEAFAALDMDSATTNVKHKRGGETEFGQEIPAMSSFESKPGPPILPPHLLQVSVWYPTICHIHNQLPR